MLSEQAKQAPITGKVYADADFWADTNGNFYETISGKTSLVISEGTLNRFTLVSRLLEMIDLSKWLTAKIPDPRGINGVPFTTVTGNFAGRAGGFHTDDLRLEGPILRFSAAGDVDIARSMLNMQIGVRPVLTVGTVVNKIPIVGHRVEKEGSSILQAYFDAYGPISDPTVRAAPITSIAEAVKRTLFLPINILRPDTVK
jgi:uncharacterized protein YhdP